METPKVAGMDGWTERLTHSWVKIHRYPDDFDVKKGYPLVN